MQASPVLNDDGFVAVCHYQASPKTVQIKDRVYIWKVVSGVSMAWVRSDDVSYILGIRRVDCSSCGGNLPIFRLANEPERRLWEGRSVR